MSTLFFVATIFMSFGFLGLIFYFFLDSRGRLSPTMSKVQDFLNDPFVPFCFSMGVAFLIVSGMEKIIKIYLGN